MSQRLQREGEGAYVLTLSLSSLTRVTLYKGGGALTTNYTCVIEVKVL